MKMKFCDECRHFTPQAKCDHPAANHDPHTGEPIIDANTFRGYGACTREALFWQPRTIRQKLRKLIRKTLGI
jgi:hypothetical protein